MSNDHNIVRTWNGKIIRFRESDGYGSLTDMAAATGKKVQNWTRTESSKAYLEALSAIAHLSVDVLIDTVNGGINEKRGTWGHSKVCIRFAQWCNPEFAVWVDFQIDELMTTGKVDLGSEPEQNPEPQKELPPNDIRYGELIDKLEKGQDILGIDFKNPRWNQALQDLAMNTLIHGNALPGDTELWLGAVEIAERMGLMKLAGISYRSALGNFLSRKIKGGVEIERRREKRLCNGTSREIWVYKDGDGVRELIQNFAEAKGCTR